MLIMKTERLIAERPKLPAETVLERSRLLAIEQRMVRAEFVFMSGGEVQDEVEEAAQSHELVEGRLENEGQVALLDAIREMSRAEARLNAGDTTPALGFERAALAALQTRVRSAPLLPADAPGARPNRSRAPSERRCDARRDPRRARCRRWSRIRWRRALRTLLHDVCRPRPDETGLDARLAARLLAADPQSSALQKIAVVIAGGSALG